MSPRYVVISALITVGLAAVFVLIYRGRLEADLVLELSTISFAVAMAFRSGLLKGRHR